MTAPYTDHRRIPPENPGHHWRQENVVAEFVRQTTAQAVQRRVLFDFACDLFPFAPGARIRVLDLGSGYGALAEAVLDRFPNATAVGLDLSEPMMAVGRERMAHFGDRFAYHVGDLVDGEFPADLPGPFDAVVTSAFILHFPSEVTQRLYAEVFHILNPGGCFVNVDQVSPANEEMQAWYREWAERARPRHGDEPEPLPNPHALMGHQVEAEAHHPHHLTGTEADQLAFLRAAGFVQVDCFYKRLLQTVIGGYKPS